MRITIAFFLAIMTVLQLHAAEAIPRIELVGMWAYGEEVTDSLKLDHKQNNLRFLLGNKENLPQDSIQYRHMLKGYGNHWINAIGCWALYTDLDPGEYEFIAQCRRTDGEWGTKISHSFTITNPWWRTPPAITSYILVILAIVSYIAYLLNAKLRIHNQLMIERKNQHFRNELVLHASREFRTSLIIIRSTIEKLKTADDRLTRTDIRHLRASSRSLMQMVEQLASFGELGAENNLPGMDDLFDRTETPINRDISVLIAEPHKELARVMKNEMQPYVDVTVSSGKDIYQILKEKTPDALVLDTDLTEINAYDLLHKLKTDPKTASVPVIIVSTFDNSRSLLRAVRSEADDFLAKPFSCEVLTALVIKKIKSAKDSKPSTAKQTEAAAQSQPVYERRTDKVFLSRLNKTINAHIAKSSFDVNALSDAMEISRIQLYNKIKELSGMSPVEYLRDRRLERAAALLRESNLTVKEVRDRVGMPDATNFHRRFKEKFGTNPGAFT